MIQYANNLSDIENALRPSPLSLAELDKFFVETEESRDPFRNRRQVLAKQLKSESPTKILLLGHPGCGKSTELAQLQKEIKPDYAFVSFSLIDEAQLSQTSIEDILVIVIEVLVRAAKRLDVQYREETLEGIYGWFSEVFKIKEDELKYGVELGVEVNTQNTWWGKMLAMGGYLKGDIRAGSQTIRKAITKENKRLSQLVYQCNLLIKEADLAFREVLKKELVLVIEDMDKISLSAADEILIQNPAPLKDLACKAIYTAPIWLLCSPRSAQLESLFRKVTLPMIKVANLDGSEYVEGRDALREILKRRMDVRSLIDGGEMGQALTLAIEKTGGVLRHLFAVLSDAASVAEEDFAKRKRKSPVILEQDIRYGLNQLKIDLVRRLGVVGLPKEYQEKKITTEDMRGRIAELADKPRKLDSDPINLLLLMSHAVIEYNGEGWHAAHPLMAEYVRESS